MDDITKRPFHETLVHAIMTADTGTIPLLCALVKTTVIPGGYEAIVSAIEYKMPMFMGAWAEELEEMRRIVLEQKTEADVRKAEQANLVPVGDKLLAMEELLLKMSPRCVKNGLTGDEARDAGKYFLELNGAIVRIYICQTRQDLREEYKVALALIEKLSKR